MMAEAGSSRVRSNCQMVAGSRDVSIPRAPCLRCRALEVRRDTERSSASEVAWSAKWGGIASQGRMVLPKPKR